MSQNISRYHPFPVLVLFIGISTKGNSNLNRFGSMDGSNRRGIKLKELINKQIILIIAGVSCDHYFMREMYQVGINLFPRSSGQLDR